MNFDSFSYGNGHYYVTQSSQLAPSDLALDQNPSTDYQSEPFYDPQSGNHGCTEMTIIQRQYYCGEHITLVIPASLFVTSIEITPSQSFFDSRSPRDWSLVGLEDVSSEVSDTTNNWKLIYQEQDYVSWSNETRSIYVDAGVAFTAFRMVVHKVGNNVSSGTSSDSWQMAELRFCGYEANRQLKSYPPLPMTNESEVMTNVQYGEGMYSVEVSTSLYGPDDDTFSGFRAFDEVASTCYHSDPNTYHSDTGIYSANPPVLTITTESILEGEYLQLDLPDLVLAGSLLMLPRGEGFAEKRSPRDWALVGSNDGSTWSLIYNASTIWSSEDAMTFDFPSNGIAFKSLRIVASTVGSTAVNGDDQESLQIAELNYFGAEVFKRPYPPAALTSTMSTCLVGQSYGNGFYYLIDSNGTIAASYAANKAFDLDPSTYYESPALFSTGHGTYRGAAATPLDDSSSYFGEYIEVELPSKLVVRAVDITPHSDYDATAPTRWALLGSNDGVTFQTISNTSTTWTSASTVSTTIDATAAFTVFRFACSGVGDASTPSASPRKLRLSELVFYGRAVAKVAALSAGDGGGGGEKAGGEAGRFAQCFESFVARLLPEVFRRQSVLQRLWLSLQRQLLVKLSGAVLQRIDLSGATAKAHCAFNTDNHSMLADIAALAITTMASTPINLLVSFLLVVYGGGAAARAARSAAAETDADAASESGPVLFRRYEVDGGLRRLQAALSECDDGRAVGSGDGDGDGDVAAAKRDASTCDVEEQQVRPAAASDESPSSRAAEGEAVPPALRRDAAARQQWRTLRAALLESGADDEAAFAVLCWHGVVLDLLRTQASPSAARLLWAYVERDMRPLRCASRWLRLASAALLVMLNVGAVYYIMLKGNTKGASWQQRFLQLYALSFLSDMLFVETLSVLWRELALPSLVHAEVAQVRGQVVAFVRRGRAAGSAAEEKEEEGEAAPVVLVRPGTADGDEPAGSEAVEEAAAVSVPLLLLSDPRVAATARRRSMHCRLVRQFYRQQRRRRAQLQAMWQRRRQRRRGSRWSWALRFFAALPLELHEVFSAFCASLLLSSIIYLWYSTPVLILVLVAVLVVALAAWYLRQWLRERRSSVLRAAAVAVVPLESAIEQLPIDAAAPAAEAADEADGARARAPSTSRRSSSLVSPYPSSRESLWKALQPSAR
eukprot:gene13595-9734_t